MFALGTHVNDAVSQECLGIGIIVRSFRLLLVPFTATQLGEFSSSPVSEPPRLVSTYGTPRAWIVRGVRILGSNCRELSEPELRTTVRVLFVGF